MILNREIIICFVFTETICSRNSCSVIIIKGTITKQKKNIRKIQKTHEIFIDQNCHDDSITNIVHSKNMKRMSINEQEKYKLKVVLVI